MAVDKHRRIDGRRDAPSAPTASGASKKSENKNTSHDNSNPYLMDLIYTYLSDNGYHKATHGIRTETQKREDTMGNSRPASWQGKATELPSLEQIFAQWKKQDSSREASTVAVGSKSVNARDVPLPESDGSSASSSGDESDDESSSSSESDNDDSEDEDEEDEVMAEADDIKAIAITSAVPASGATALKRKRSPSTSSSEESSESEADSSSDESDGSEEEPAAKKVKVAGIAVVSKDEDSEDSTSDEGSDDEVARAAEVTLPESSDDSSISSSEEEEESSEESEDDDNPAAAFKSATVAAKPVKGKVAPPPAQEASDESSESDNEAEDSSSESDSDSDSSSDAESPTTQPTTNETSSVEDHKGSESSETLAHPSPEFQPVTYEEDDVHPSRKQRIDGLETAATAPSKHKKSNVPFSRIRDDTMVDPRLASNAYVPYDYAQRAHEKLIVTKGKGFTKEKNKGKRGSYRGGMIDIQGTKGIKFED